VPGAVAGRAFPAPARPQPPKKKLPLPEDSTNTPPAPPRRRAAALPPPRRRAAAPPRHRRRPLCVRRRRRRRSGTHGATGAVGVAVCRVRRRGGLFQHPPRRRRPDRNTPSPRTAPTPSPRCRAAVPPPCRRRAAAPPRSRHAAVTNRVCVGGGEGAAATVLPPARRGSPCAGCGGGVLRQPPKPALVSRSYCGLPG